MSVMGRLGGGGGWGWSVTFSQLPIVSPFLSQLGKKMDTPQKPFFSPTAAPVGEQTQTPRTRKT